MTFLKSKTAAQTHAQIAKALGLKKTPYTLELIEQLCDQGRVSWDWSKTRNNLRVKVYSPTWSALNE
jgi:hypothetical protein